MAKCVECGGNISYVTKDILKCEYCGKLYSEIDGNLTSANQASIYETAVIKSQSTNPETLEEAIELFSILGSYKNSGSLEYQCRNQIHQNKIAQEEKRLEERRQAELAEKAYKVQKEKDAQIRKAKLIAIATIIGFVVIVGTIIGVSKHSKNVKYENAVNLYEQGHYEEAMEAFEKMGDYKDAKSQVESIRNQIQVRKNTYEQGIAYYNTATSNVVYDNTQSLERLLHNAETYIRLRDYRTAFDVYQNITKLYPEDYRGWWGLIRANTEDFTIKKDGCKNDIVKWFGYVRELADDDSYKEKLKDYLEVMKKYDSEKWINDELHNVDEIIKKYNKNIGEQTAQIDQLYQMERSIRLKYEKEAESRKEEKQYQKGLAELSQERQGKSSKSLVILAVLLVSLIVGNIVAHYTFLGRIIQICGVVAVIYLIRKTNEESRFQIYMDSQEQTMEKPVCISEQDQKQLDILEKKMQQCNEIIKEYKNKISECNLYKQMGKEKLTEILFALECSKYGIQREIPSNLKELRKKVIGA